MLWCDTTWPVIGGVEVLAARFVRALRERGHELLLLSSTCEPDLPEQDAFGDVRLLRLPFREALEGRDLPAMLRLRERVADVRREFRPDIVHVFHSGPSTFFHLQTASICRAQVVATLHQNYADDALAPETIRGRLFRSAAWTVACSSSVLEAMVRQVPEVAARSSVIPNSLDMPRMTPTTPPTAPRLLCIGRLLPQKGFDLALVAVALVAAGLPGVRLLLAGDGPERGALEDLSRRLGLDGRVEFLGWVDPDEIPGLINDCRAVLMPSRVEPFGLVALQAGQMERPIIATRVGGLVEVVEPGENGFLVEPDDVEGLARAIRAVLTDSDLAVRLGRSGRLRAQTTFSWSRHVESYEALYKRLAQAESQ